MDKIICQQFDDIDKQLADTIKLFDTYEPNQIIVEQQHQEFLDSLLANNPNLAQYQNNITNFAPAQPQQH